MNGNIPGHCRKRPAPAVRRKSIRGSNMSQNYHEFLKSKRLVVKPSGFEPDGISEILFPFQKDIVRWACKKGKAAIFAGTGLGKTGMQLEWAHQVHQHTGADVLV